jgi:rare lipoprotein A
MMKSDQSIWATSSFFGSAKFRYLGPVVISVRNSPGNFAKLNHLQMISIWQDQFTARSTPLSVVLLIQGVPFIMLRLRLLASAALLLAGTAQMSANAAGFSSGTIPSFSTFPTDSAPSLDDRFLQKPQLAPLAPGQQIATAGTQVGQASWYGPGFYGGRTANGEVFRPGTYTAAHRWLPFGTRVRVTNLNNGLKAVVRINDRGPFSGGRIIDLAHGAASALGLTSSGIAQVRLEVLD